MERTFQAMETQKPHPLLEQLLPLLPDPDFDEIFNRMTHDESNNTRFLLKMELKRKASPCIRSIDLRARRNAMPYVYKGIQHFMPPEDIEVFENALKIYQGNYTLGVYETVLESQKQRLQQESSLAQDPGHDRFRFEVDAIPFASYYYRREERMHYSSPVQLIMNEQTVYGAKTSDISCGGVRLLLAEAVPFEVGDLCQVIFTGLQKDTPAAVINRPVLYQILGEEARDGRFWLKLLRAEPDSELDGYLASFIDNNKLHYRVGIEHLLSAIEAKGYEQYYLPRMTGLPLFFSQGAAPALRFALKSENNQPVLEYWRDERNHDKLSGLFSPARMEQLLAQPGDYKCCWLYTFTHTVRSHIYFFSATSEELNASGLRKLFFTVGARRPSWRVFKFELEPVQLGSGAIANLITQENLPPGYLEQLKQQLAEIGYVGQLIAVDDDLQRRDYLSDALTRYEANQLQIYAHQTDVPECELEMLHYAQLRKERRYSHKTTVSIHTPSTVALGWTRDISTHGLQLELEKPLACQKGDLLLLNLPQLQALTRDVKLQGLPYRVINTNQAHTVLHLCIDGEPELHVGRRFFQRLIDSNPDKLRATHEMRRTSGLSRALRNLFTYHLFNHPLYLSKNKPSRLGAIGSIDKPRALLRLLTESTLEKPFNVMPLFQGDLLKKLLLLPLRELNRSDAPLQRELFIARLTDQNGNLIYESRLEESFFNLEEKRRFIQRALHKGGFYSVRLFLSRTGRPDTDFIAAELDYVAKYAIHKAKQLEETLWSVVGVCDLLDTTAATLFRVGLTPSGGELPSAPRA